LFLALVEGPVDQRSRGLLGEALAAKFGEHRVADLGAADDFRRSVEAAVAGGLFVSCHHQARQPRALIWIYFHAVELDWQESASLVCGGKFFGQSDVHCVLCLGPLACDQVPDGLGI